MAVSPEIACNQTASRVIDYGDGELRIPLWVRSRISCLGRHFTGKITINIANGGVPNFQVTPSGGESVTFHLSR